MLAEFRKETSIDLSGDRLAMQRLREAAEKVRDASPARSLCPGAAR